MSKADAVLNLIISLVTMLPLALLSWWIIRRTPLKGLSGTQKWQAYRIRIGAGSIILLTAGLMFYFVLNLWQ